MMMVQGIGSAVPPSLGLDQIIATDQWNLGPGFTSVSGGIALMHFTAFPCPLRRSVLGSDE
jgi:hypothetical protein